jgi:hypothetical protein
MAWSDTHALTLRSSPDRPGSSPIRRPGDLDPADPLSVNSGRANHIMNSWKDIHQLVLIPETSHYEPYFNREPF